jgi:hypothetical protein
VIWPALENTPRNGEFPVSIAELVLPIIPSYGEFVRTVDIILNFFETSTGFF